MPAYFEMNAYLKTMEKNRAFSDLSKIFSYASKNSQFRYGEVSLSSFSIYYTNKGWFGRKILAIPAVFYSGVIKATYHFAKMCFSTIGMITSEDKEFQKTRIKAHVFAWIRDYEEALGRFLSLFYDRIGQYLVQESHFHKSCYDCFSEKDPILGGIGSFWTPLIKKIPTISG